MIKFYAYLAPFLCYSILVSTCFVSNENIRQEFECVSNTTEWRNVYRVSYGDDVENVNEYEYNEEGDIVKQYTLKDTIIFIYGDKKISKKYNNSDENWISEIEYNLSQNGKVVSSKIIDKERKEVSSYVYIYDRDGYLVTTIQKVFAGNKIFTNNFKYDGGNISEVILFDGDGNINSKYLLEYDKSLLNNLNLNPDAFLTDIFANERMGKRNKNALKQLINVSKTGDTLSVLKYSYVLTPNKDCLIYNLVDVMNGNETLITYHFNLLNKP